MKNRIFQTIVTVVMMVILLFVALVLSEDKELQKETVEKITDTITKTYEMSEEEIEALPTTEIEEQTEEQEKEVSEEQEVESEGFELQGEIAYEGDRANTWNVELGDYKGLTYYSQIDNRWRYKMYSSIGDSSQTIGSSGCGSTSAAMVVTAIKGTITPDTMSDLFVKYGYRSANQGTYWSAFRAVADEFNIGYTETTDIQKALQLLENKNLIVVSCGNGLFTTGGHFIVIVGKEGDNLKIYDPYLYAGKFETSTRRGKVTVSGNTVYCPVDNFINYANPKGFFCFSYDEEVKENAQPVTTATYTRYVKVNTSLNVRNAPNGSIVGSLSNGTQVTVYETNGNWSRIGDNKWVYSDYLYSTIVNTTTVQKTTEYTTGTYKVTASVLNVRTGPGTNYSAKTWRQLTANARSQNSRLGNYYTNGLKRGVAVTITEIRNGFGKCPSGWISLAYCTKL